MLEPCFANVYNLGHSSVIKSIDLVSAPRTHTTPLCDLRQPSVRTDAFGERRWSRWKRPNLTARIIICVVIHIGSAMWMTDDLCGMGGYLTLSGCCGV